MVSIAINIGDAFLINTPPNDQHLYIAIASTSKNRYLFVNVTTSRNNSEMSCVLLPGSDMPDFISRESVVTYKYAREISTEELASFITSGSPIPKCVFLPAVVMLIQQGGLSSKQLKNKYKVALKDFLQE